MIIKLFPFLTEDALSVFVKDDVITINGEPIDLSGVLEGYTLPGRASGCWWLFSGPIERKGQELTLTLRLPVWHDSYEHYRVPLEPMVIDVKGGEVSLPNTRPSIVELPVPQPGISKGEHVSD